MRENSVKKIEKKVRLLFEYLRFLDDEKLCLLFEKNENKATLLADDQLFAIAGGKPDYDNNQTTDLDKH